MQRKRAMPIGRRWKITAHALPIPSGGCCCASITKPSLKVPDRRDIGRVYLPESWMDLAGGEAQFFDPANTEARRAVLDAALDQVEERLDAAAALPRLIAAKRLARESAVTITLARRLLVRLRVADPVLGRVALSRLDFLHGFRAALSTGPSDAALVSARVGRAGSSFARGMSALKGERRRALWAVYAFCRAVDDIADGAMPEAEKRRFLSDWRNKLRAPDCALSRELALARNAFALPIEECEAMIAGMETDATPSLRLADTEALNLYCRRVAGSVGAMAVRIFGAPEAADFGLALGRTLQLVNILRDLDGRCCDRSNRRARWCRVCRPAPPRAMRRSVN